MKVKIGTSVYDSEKEPIMLTLSNEEKGFISNMPFDKHKFCSFPEEIEENKIREFMKD